MVSHYIHDPHETHLYAVFWILWYLKPVTEKCLLLSRNDHLKIEVFTDIDWAGSPDDRKSATGYYTLVGGNLITWKSKK